LKRIDAIVRPERLDFVIESLNEAGFHGFTIADARGHGRSPERVGEWRGVPYEMLVTHKLSIAVIVEDDEVEGAVNAICRGGATGALGDGLVTVTELVAVFPIRAQAAGAATGDHSSK
jgi:nitrogen regulatory protein PII